MASTNVRIEWIDQFNEFVRTIDIYRTIIITKTIEDKIDLYNVLRDHEYSVFKTNYILADEIEFEIFIEKNRRIFITTFDEFCNYSPIALKNISDEHNFLILDRLVDYEYDHVTKIFMTIRKDHMPLKPNYVVWQS